MVIVSIHQPRASIWSQFDKVGAGQGLLWCLGQQRAAASSVYEGQAQCWRGAACGKVRCW